MTTCYYKRIRLAWSAQDPRAVTDPKTCPPPGEVKPGCYLCGVSSDHPKTSNLPRQQRGSTRAALACTGSSTAPAEPRARAPGSPHGPAPPAAAAAAAARSLWGEVLSGAVPRVCAAHAPPLLLLRPVPDCSSPAAHPETPDCPARGEIRSPWSGEGRRRVCQWPCFCWLARKKRNVCKKINKSFPHGSSFPSF